MSITLEPKLQTKLDEIARRLGRSAEEIADEAIRAHLEELDRHALAEEEGAYQRLYPELRRQYAQQVVAIYGGRVVDADPDFETLFLRVRQQVGDRAVLMRRVGETPHEEYRFRSPRLEQTP
jgi:predicted DNA-binding protein